MTYLTLQVAQDYIFVFNMIQIYIFVILVDEKCEFCPNKFAKYRKIRKIIFIVDGIKFDLQLERSS